MALDLSRRSLFALGAGLAVGVGLAGSRPVAARAPLLGTQAPYFYRFTHGAAEVTIVSDGTLPLGDPAAVFLGVDKDEIRSLLASNFLPTDNSVLEQNIPIVNTGDKLVLFDTGMGILTSFGPTTGRIRKSLEEAGIAPEAIDAVVCSHAHIDHIGGIVDTKKEPVFPNAQIYLNQADFDFWTDEGKLGGEMKSFIEHARYNLLPVRDRIVFFKDGEEFLPGIQALHAPGHTVGHTMFMVSSGGKPFCFTGDLAHHQVIMLEKPRIEFAYDTDPKQAAATRVKFLDMLATDRIPIVSYHFPWPGFGHIARVGEAFRYHPEPMRMIR